MDFTLSLAHFCELHGPTSVICTQTLATDCDRCFPSSNASTPTSVEDNDDSYFAPPSTRRSNIAPQLARAADGERCDSCSIQPPPQPRNIHGVNPYLVKPKAVPFRTREDLHICADGADGNEDEPHHMIRCHSHNMEYVSSSSPVKPETFVALRNATVRTLSGEQLPRGQRSGPLCFGDRTTGYTVAYYFRLADGHARGKERYYALLALVGTDTRRAFESCTFIWDLFERIALHIINMAEEVLQKNKLRPDIEKPEKEHQITPVSSFLTQRNLDPDGVPRRGVESIRANNITELVDNANFFCELHMMFVKMLQELGKIFGGMKVVPRSDVNHDLEEHKMRQTENAEEHDEDNFRMSPLPKEQDTSSFSTPTVTPFELPNRPTLTPSPSPKPQTVLA